MEYDDLDEDIERLQIILRDGDGEESESEFARFDNNDEEYISNPSRPSTSSDFTASSFPTTSVCTDADDIPIRFDPNTVTAESCLAMNQAYQEVLLDTLRQIEMALFENRACQKQLEESLQEKVQSTSKKADKSDTPYSMLSVNKILPYFRDSTGELPPPNPDVKLKAQMNIDKQHVKPNFGWSKEQRKTLIDAVKLDSLEKILRPAMNKVELEMSKLQQCKSKEETSRCKTRIEELKEDLKIKQNMSADESLRNVETSKIDFLKIAAMHFDGKFDASECESMWKNVLHPGINRDKWTAEEDDMLKVLAKKYQMRNWKQIADELGTKRTPYQCLQHFQRNNLVYDNSEWKEDEDLMLKEVIDNFSYPNKTIKWFQVAYYMENRSAEQCRKRWNVINPEKKLGRWSPEEDTLLINAVQKMGMVQDWMKVQELVPNRTAAQCRERYLNRLSDKYSGRLWTYSEDKKLLLLQQKYGHDWLKISSWMDKRTEMGVQARYKRLMKWQDEMNHFHSYPIYTQKQNLHSAFEIGEKGEITIKAGLKINRGANMKGRPAGAKSKTKRKSESVRLREEAGVLSSDDEVKEEVQLTEIPGTSTDITTAEDTPQKYSAEAKKKRRELEKLQADLEMFLGFYNIDGFDYRRQNEDKAEGNFVVPRPVPSKNFKERKMPSVWKKRSALMDLVQTHLDQYLNKMQGASAEDNQTSSNLYDEIFNSMKVEGGSDEEKKKLIYSAFGGKNPGRLTVRELLNISRNLKEHGKLPQQPRKNKPDNWTPADSSDEEMIDVDSDDEEEEDEDQENYEEDGQNVIKKKPQTQKQIDARKIYAEKMALHAELNKELKALMKSKMCSSEFKGRGRRKKFSVYSKKTLMEFKGMEEDVKLNRKSTVLLMKALDVDGRKAYLKAHRGKRKLTAMALLKTAEKSSLKQAKTRHQKSEILRGAKEKAETNAEFMEVADYVLDVHDELKINEEELKAIDEEEDKLLASGKNSIATCTVENAANDGTSVEKLFPYLPPNQTTLRGMRGLLLEHRRLIDQAGSYFNPAELRDKLYDLKNKGPNPFIGVLNVAGKTESAFRKGRDSAGKKSKKVTATPAQCYQQLKEERKSPAYQQLKARFQSIFSWPALLATIPPPVSSPLPKSLQALAVDSQKTVKQLENLLNANEEGKSRAGNIEDSGDDEDDEEETKNLTEEEAIEKLVQKIMNEYELLRVQRRGPPRKKNKRYFKKERTEILKKLGLYEKMQDYQRRREAASSTVTMETKPAVTNAVDVALPTVSATATPAPSENPTSPLAVVKEDVLNDDASPDKNNESTNPTDFPANTPHRGKGRPKGSKTKRYVPSDTTATRRSLRSVERQATRSEDNSVYVSPAKKKKQEGTNRSRYANIKEFMPKNMGNIVTQISEIPLLNEPNPPPKKSPKKKRKRGQPTKTTNTQIQVENERLAEEVRMEITNEILTEFEGLNNEQSETETGMEEIEGAEALVALAHNSANSISDQLPTVLNNSGKLGSGELGRTQEAVRECMMSNNNTSNAEHVVTQNIQLGKISNVKIPSIQQSVTGDDSGLKTRGNANNMDGSDTVDHPNPQTDPVFIGIPIIVDGTTRLACIGIHPDKVGKITLPDNNKVDGSRNEDQSVASVNVNSAIPSSEDN